MTWLRDTTTVTMPNWAWAFFTACACLLAVDAVIEAVW